jgi:hypothetical protein
MIPSPAGLYLFTHSRVSFILFFKSAKQHYCSSGIIDRSFTHTINAKTVNETLVEHGVIGGSPEQPTVGFTLHFLECFRQLHRVCPRLTLWGVAIAIQHIHNVNLTVPIIDWHLSLLDPSAGTFS